MTFFSVIKIVNANNKPIYSFNLNDLVYFDVNIDNKAGSFTQVKLNVSSINIKLYYLTIFLNCFLCMNRLVQMFVRKLPTFKLLTDKKTYKYRLPCPTQFGENQNLKITMNVIRYV